jgi:DNA-binding NarL/FixJ family response regulator
LVDHSLIRREAVGDAEQRFVMLETIREFGVEQLAAYGEAETVRAAHARYFLALAETNTSRLKGPEQGRWLDRFEVEHGNLRAALAWFAQADDAEAALRLVVALIHFWLVRGHLSEGRAWGERLLAAARDRSVDPAVRCRALYGTATLAQVQRDLVRATELLEEALRWPQLAEDTRALADVNNSLGTIAFDRGDLDRAVGSYEAAISHYQAINHLQGAAGSRNNLAEIWRRRGELDRAITLYEQALTEWRAAGHSHGVALAANNLGSIATGRGDLATAAAYHREGLATFRQIGDRLGLATSLEHVADLALAAGQPAEAIRLLAAAAARALIGFLAADDASNAETLAAARAALDPATAAAIWESGSALPLERALEAAGRVIETPASAPSTAAASLDALSERESEVLRLLAAGRSDREIGEVLFISHRTAARHVANIYRKLGVHTRGEAAASARLHGLV